MSLQLRYNRRLTAENLIPVGLVGFGVAGRIFHAPVIRAVPGLHLTTIVQRTDSSAQETYSDVRVVRNLDELLADESIRLVVIATPNDSHYTLARQCLLAGRNVVVDKPFTTTSREAQDLGQLAHSKGRVLSVYQNRRWDGYFLTVLKLIDSAVLAEMEQVEREMVLQCSGNGRSLFAKSAMAKGTPWGRGGTD
jgi:predicted dehydrogenase